MRMPWRSCGRSGGSGWPAWRRFSASAHPTGPRGRIRPRAPSRPATSGSHYPTWLDPAGPVIDHPVDRGLEGYAVHNLEHGYVLMYYRPARVPRGTIDALAALARSEEKVMLARYERLPPDAAVVFAAWQRLRICSEAGHAEVMSGIARDFIERFRGDAGLAPEPSGG